MVRVRFSGDANQFFLFLNYWVSVVCFAFCGGKRQCEKENTVIVDIEMARDSRVTL